MLWFRISNRSQLDKIIITAMDRFVWFVILVVMSHLVTEFTRVTGYARGNRQELELSTVNESLIEPKSVHNMILYPGQQDSLCEQQAAAMPNYYQNGNQANRYVYNGLQPQQLYQQAQQQQQQPNAQLIMPASNGGAGTQQQTPQQQGFTFSFRPLIDSIFDIPISTLRAVNNLVARLTGSYQTPPATYSAQKSATSTLVIETERSNDNVNHGSAAGQQTARTHRSSKLREVMA